ncbi:AAA family ATPase [Brevibacterium sp. FAM 24630]|uniref:AAA family ATPase n=1 Tax=unclassified Brevibacterium TaxID=2614124 RepID=UPI003C7D0FC7
MFTHIFLNGTVGVGKSTTADEIAVILAEAGVPHAVIDLDGLRRSWPCNDRDPFNHEIEMQNLSAVASNYRAAGAEVLVLAGVLEDRDEIPRYRAACGGGPMAVCRITADEAAGEARLRGRHHASDDELKWHLARFKELSSIIDEAGAFDAVFDSTQRKVRDVAVDVIRYSNPDLLERLDAPED